MIVPSRLESRMIEQYKEEMAKRVSHVDLTAMLSKKVPRDLSASGHGFRIQHLFITATWTPQNIKLSTWGRPGWL